MHCFFYEHSYTDKGKVFVSKLENYKATINSLFKDDLPQILELLDKKFQKPHNNQDWLISNFKGFPLVTVLTKLTQIQSDITFIEEEILLQIATNKN